MDAFAPIDFFVAGVQKAGTTALAHYLSQHPGIDFCRVKESHHFDDENLNWSHPDRTGLHRHFDWSLSGMLRGDATPIYTYWPNALERIRAYNPDAKIIVSLRHPAFRAYSHWRMETARNRETLPFEGAISRVGRQRVTDSPGGVHRTYSYVERGFYAEQIARILEFFPRDRVMFLRNDELWSDPFETLARIEAFLSLPACLANTITPEYVVPLVGIGTGQLDMKVRSLLDDLFAEDIKRTAELTELNLSDWLSSSYVEYASGRPRASRVGLRPVPI